MPLPLLPMHLGALHPFEQALTLLLAFGPFVVLGIVVWVSRREDDREVREEDPTLSERPSRTAPPGRQRAAGG